MTGASERPPSGIFPAGQADICLPIDDLLFTTLPLLRQVAALHDQGKVAALEQVDLVQNAAGILELRAPAGQAPTANQAAIDRVQSRPGSALNVIGESRVTADDDGLARKELRAGTGTEEITKPIYLPGFVAWEAVLDHHDEITDIFQLGLLLACLSCGLAPADPSDISQFASSRNNLFRLNRHLHPVAASVIVEMTALNRHERAKDLHSIIRRLETYRDQPVGLDLERLLAEAEGAVNRRTAVLAHLRDRLFDLSRRNKLIHFRPTQGTVNLTVASVPIVLRIESIRPEQLATWQGAFGSAVLSGESLSLNQWLRFEDQPYLTTALERLIHETRRDRAEYGFSSLRLVVAFLRWHNLKEAPDDRITSPLLWLPVELIKRKGVRDQFMLQCRETEAEFNPALRHHLRRLYDIKLPETIDLAKPSLDQIHADLAAQIHASEPGVDLRYLTKPSIELVHERAVQRIRQFERRRRVAASEVPTLVKPSFSYDREDYRPLGLALFRQYVQPSPLPLRAAVGALPEPRRQMMAPNSAAVESATFVLGSGQGHRFAWDLDLSQVTLANFNYQKMSLVRDYNQLLEEAAPLPSFDSVFSIEPRPIETEAVPATPIAEQWDVVQSDATQRAAIDVARSERSFIIQGPPGTGKSQTITNLIADFAGRGQRVLFVCEKRAALDVVFHRLKESGLDDLCCLIHDSQTDKKAFVQDLKNHYERWIAAPHNHEIANERRRRTAGKLQTQLGRLAQFEARMMAAPDSLACTPRSLVSRLAQLAPPEATITPSQRERLPDYAIWCQYRELTQRLHRAAQQRLGVASLAEHPFARLGTGLVGQDRAYGTIEQLLERCDGLLDRLTDALEDEALLPNAETSLAEALSLAEAAMTIVDLKLAGALDLLDEHSTGYASLAAEFSELDQLMTHRDKAVAAAADWRDRFQPEETQSALTLARRLEPSLWRFFSPAWRRLAGEMRRRFDSTRHPIPLSKVRMLELLAAEQAANGAVDAAAARLCDRLGQRDLSHFQAGHSPLVAALKRSPLLRDFLARLRIAESPHRLAAAEAEALPTLRQLADAVAVLLFDGGGLTLGALAESVRDLREALEDLPDFLPLLRAVAGADLAYAETVRTIPGTPAALEALVAGEALQRLLRADPDFARFDGRILAQTARRAEADERRLRACNAVAVRAGWHRRFLDNVRRAGLSASQLDEAGKGFKKAYAAGRRELEHEFGKSVRYRSVRDLASGQSGLVINDLKPIWLMSPLSVSDTLPLNRDLFDVAIFDEASQIPTEDAIPALSRARQIIVVGDEMQLPPTSFFSAARETEEVEVVAEEEGERIAINLDADNLLSQSTRNLPAALLAWHYRSRHEALISFSNAAFYEGRLVTVPDRRLDTQLGAEAPLFSNGEAAAGVDSLLDRPISYHRLADGLYLDRSNQPEAHYIALLVRELLQRETRFSIGIVAFSEAQQNEIDSALERLAAEDTAFATLLDREQTREDDDQFNGLFVKNLENVQGDERDIILLSVCYGPGPNGRMQMNFGPINQRGGEKRLNVIFSRARHRMAIVTSIDAEAITNTHNDGAAALRGFLDFARASASGKLDRSQSILAALNAGASVAFAEPVSGMSVQSALASALRRRGHVVHESVGRSRFRCDLAIVSPDGDSYTLGILIDAPVEAVDPRERYVFRPAVLRAFGWRVLDLPSLDWLRAPDAVLERIDQALLEESDQLLDESDDDIDWPEQDVLPVEPTATRPSGPVSANAREFRFQQGGSNKFWRIEVVDGSVTVTFGRIGSTGQSLVKEHGSAERAEREARKLIEEKTRKGYKESQA